ncbi:DnaB-like helicase C-terminal domain-containing protein [Vibrio crassostreae]|uniref:DnaB-like helicase C-terminal domain-containing protein n=1 Tax=Vibrio crassostreae TaxID=246167 RepID=UPI001B30677C|nr:DnaB-like helicase C-terminal domain-containing protein [Vibrio crassostreae]
MNAVTNYSIDRSRAITEQAVVNALVNNPSYCDKFDLTLLKKDGHKKIADMVAVSAKSSLDVSPNFFFNKAMTIFKPEHEGVVAKICREQPVSEDDFSSLVDSLKEVTSRENVVDYAQSIIDRGLKGEDIKDICSIGQMISDEANGLTRGATVYSVGDALEGALSEIYEAKESDQAVGVPYHLKSLRNNLVGMFPTDLVVVAARPAVGKTALALNLAYHAPEGSFGIISSEMSKEQLAKRWISMETGVNGNLLRDPRNLPDSDLKLVEDAVAKLKGRDFYIEDKGAITIAEIEEIVELWVKLHGVKVVMVDYIQRINSDKTHNSEAERIGWITKRLKEMAKRLGVCVIGLAQINRDSSKENRRPKMSDIKGSGDIEQEADAILLLHKPTMGTSEANSDCIVEAILEKNRHGQVGILVMVYQPQKINFADPTENQLQQYLM